MDDEALRQRPDALVNDAGQNCTQDDGSGNGRD